jgi:hypothetical protein
LRDFGDGDPDVEESQGPVVPDEATFYLAATIVPEPALGLGSALRRAR